MKINFNKYLSFFFVLFCFISISASAQGVYDYYLQNSSPPLHVILKNILGKAWEKQHETLKKNKVRKIEVYESERFLWFMFLINKKGFINYQYWYDEKDISGMKISYDEYNNFYFSSLKHPDNNWFGKTEYEGSRIISISRDSYHYQDPERYNPPVIYKYFYDGADEKVNRIEVINADNDSAFTESIFTYDKEGKLIDVKSWYDENLKISYSGDTIKREGNTFFHNTVIKDDIIVSENSGTRDSVKYRLEWKSPNGDYLFNEDYVYSEKGLLDKIIRRNYPSGTEWVIYFKYKFYE